MGNKRLEEILSLVMPGTKLREGLNNILEAGLGALIVAGFDEGVKKTTDGGFFIDCDFTPERVYELAKMDGAIILDEECKKIMFANVHLQPERNFVSEESGTRHRTAQRIAKQTGKIVIAVSERRNVITIYQDDFRYRLRDVPSIESEASQAIKTTERYKAVLDRALANLIMLELENTATLYDVATTLQRFEMLRRIGRDVKRCIVELGTEGRLLNLQFQDINRDIEEDEYNLIRDYMNDSTDYKEVKEKMEKLDDDELIEVENYSHALGYGKSYATLDNEVTPKGYRILGKISKLTKKDVEKLIGKYKTFSKLQYITDEELSEQKISKTKIKALRNGLKRLKLTVELEKL